MTWRDTTSLSYVCCAWRRIVIEAKQCFPEWRTTVLGPSSTTRESLKLLQTNHLNWADTRFPPNLILFLVASQDSTSWRRGKFWIEAITTIEKAHLLPANCQFIGIYTMHKVLGNEISIENSNGIVLSVSVAHFPDTTLESAEYDRKVVKWSQQGLKLNDPFSDLKDDTIPCFLLFGVNTQSADQLVQIVENWYPGAAIIGTVSNVTDRCLPLVSYCKSKCHDSQHIQLQKQRQLHFPCTMLVRVHGNVSFRSFSANGYDPITPIIQCNRVHLVDEFKHIMMYDIVSMEELHSRLLDLLNPSDRLKIQQDSALNLVSCSNKVPLEHLMNSSNRDFTSSERFTCLDVTISVDETIQSQSICWSEGDYGILTLHDSTKTWSALNQAFQHLQSNLFEANEQAFGAFITGGSITKVDEIDFVNNVRQVWTHVFQDLPVGGYIASTSVGPLALFRGLSSPCHNTIQINTICGAIFYVKKRHICNRNQ
ncbi:uncharacterized protein PHALS_04165 [Plasmopara halstedii]|uniref:FIST C-domain domain-containing protein n=1 Tax=Plasmopara halstedii TaxID=4781 RepID=A0A0P1A8U7_PLAHL|nr:uncharacterized protein PHALS_04165 [Plasmopara halstedii]CEG36914.1 hypothetical protein PHALS_04165 [Plasmopara halstedii]|eukprot:XP_024573283.1 hypothetical protein PHALS_04165 [Plasmopara halstedii]